MNLWKSAIENLKGDPSAGLAGLDIVAGMALLGLGLGPYIALGFPGTIYLLYLLKGLFDNHHDRMMADLDVKRIEAGKGKQIRQRTQRSLEKRRTEHGKS